MQPLEDVYQKYTNDLYRYLLSLSKDHFIAEDLVQEAYYRAFVKMEDYEICDIKAWLFKVAYHAFVDYKRKEKRMIPQEPSVHNNQSDAYTPEKWVLERESLQNLLELLSYLSEIEKHAIILCDLHDFSYQEASDILEVKLNTFKSHLLRGRRKLKSILKERMKTDE